MTKSLTFVKLNELNNLVKIMKNIVGLKELRQNMTEYTKRVAKGESFLVFKQSQPIFKITPPQDEEWEELIDFTKIKKGGVKLDEILSRL